MSSADSNLPAILGGSPEFPGGPPDWPRPDESVANVLREIIESRNWGRYHAPHVPELCRHLSEYHGVEHVLPCSSGTSAIEMALRGVGVVDGDEVVLAAYDFKANFQNILVLKAIPVLIDVDPGSWQFDPDRLESALSPKTRAIIVSHLHGGVVDVPRVRRIVESRGIAVIEDACQNPGAVLFGRRAGTGGDVGVLSFGGSKLLTAGRGGAILTSKSEIAERIKRYVFRGNDAYPLSEIQAALLQPQLASLDDANQRRTDAVMQLSQFLSDFGGLRPLQLPTKEIQPVYYKVGFQFIPECFGEITRHAFCKAMRAEGIALDPGFRSNHLIHASRRFRSATDFVEASLADARMVTLHHPVLLECDRTMQRLVHAIRKVRDYASEIVKIRSLQAEQFSLG